MGDSLYTLDVSDGFPIINIDNIKFIVCNYSGHGSLNTEVVDASNDRYNYEK